MLLKLSVYANFAKKVSRLLIEFNWCLVVALALGALLELGAGVG